MNPVWRVSSVADCLASVSFVGRTKVQSRDYKRAGLFPVIDQGQSEIAGWTDDENAVIREPLPVLVFGDHTRAMKYIDFPFARGADGTQILKPKSGIDVLYFYYACRALDLPPRGYNRHFALLKEQLVGLPPEHEQIAIAKTLSLTEDAIAIETGLVECALALKNVVMHDIFTRGLRSESLKETTIGPIPESWATSTLGELCSIQSGGTPPKTRPDLWDGPVPWASGKDLKANRLADVPDHISLNAAEEYTKLAPAGSVIALVRGMGLANGFALSLIERPMAFNQDLKALIPRDAVSGSFLMHSLTYAGERMLRNVTNAAHGTKRLTQDDLDRFLIPVPNAPEQQEMVNILDAIDQKIDLHKRKKIVVQELFKALLNGLITGEISVSSLDLSAVEKPAPGATAPTMETAV